MAGPPKNIAPSQLWAALTTMPRAHRLVDFPRKDADGKPVGQVAMWVLNQEEHSEATSSAERYTRGSLQAGDAKGIAGTTGYDGLFGNALAVEMLVRACRRPEDLSLPAFPGADAIRRVMTTDEVGVLFETYLMVQSELGPIVAEMSKEEVDTWCSRLEEGGSLYPFAGMSSETRLTLLRTLARRLASSRTDSSSAGTQPEEHRDETTASE